MLKVMVVDDDYLVRQGFIRIMPWADYGMEISAEAGSGEDALAILERQPIDLLITDLAMPMMSGIELMKQVKERYSNTEMVVLTFHHDFDLVRDALRLGALDYITKIELEQDQMATILQRIRNRIEGHAPLPSTDPGSGSRDRRYADDIAYCRASRIGSERIWDIEADEAEKENEKGTGTHRGEVSIRWHGVKGMPEAELLERLRLHGERILYYRLERDTAYYDWPAAWLKENPIPGKDAIIKLGRELSALAWMSDDALFEQLVAQAEALQLPAAQIEQMIYMAIEEWSKFFETPLFRFHEAGRPQTWREWVNWLREVRASILGSDVKPVYSFEVTTGILRAADYIKQDLRREIQLPAMAEKVHMSRSYFSRCFRDIMGKTFQDYVRDLKISHAKTLLRRTNKSVGWVAAESGYPNEKYFSKVFRESTGMLPSVYRKKTGEVTDHLL